MMAIRSDQTRQTAIEADGVQDGIPSPGFSQKARPSVAAAQPRPRSTDSWAYRRERDNRMDVERSAICEALTDPAVWPVLRALGERACPTAELPDLDRLVAAGLVTRGEHAALTPLGRDCWTGSLRHLYR